MLRRVVIAACAMLGASCATTRTNDDDRGPTNLAVAEDNGPRELLNGMVGRWVLSGVIAGDQTVHDVEADWVLQRSYVRITEVSRERDAQGHPLYEAIVLIGWLERENRFVCFWFDNTEVAGGAITCSAPPTPDAIPFEFRDGNGGLVFLNTFVLNRRDDTWEWRMENVRGEERDTFGLVTLRRN